MKNKNISTPPRTRARSRKGGTLISIIAVMLILGVLGASVITFTHTTEHSHLSANAGSRAYYLAESGLRYAQQVYCSEPDEDLRWRHGREQTLTLLGGEQVDVIRLAGNFWATAFVDGGTAQEARARVPMPLSLCGVDPNANPADEFAIFGEIGISLGTQTIIQGDVAITDDNNVTIQGEVDGDVLANDIELGSNGTITGDIYSSGTVQINSGTVTGDIHSENGIILSNAQTQVEGWLFSNGSISLSGGADVFGHIHSCGGDVTLGGNPSANYGTTGERIEVRASRDVILSGSADVYGDVYAGGNIILSGSAKIEGNAYAGLFIIGDITKVTGFAFENTYVKEPICPDLSNLDGLILPEATDFGAGGDPISQPNVGPDYILEPDVYGVLSTNRNAKLYLNAGSTGHGNYYFDSVSFGRETELYLDLSGTNDIRIFVLGNIEVARDFSVWVSEDGLPPYIDMSLLSDVEKENLTARVYWESHGNFSLAQSCHWFGTVYTSQVDGNLSVGSSCYLIGSYYSKGGHSFSNDTEIFHVAPNYFEED